MNLILGVVVVWIFILKGNDGYLKYDPPRIIVEPLSGKDYITTAGSTFTLTCEGRKPIIWDPPPNGQKHMYEITTSEHPLKSYPYHAKLTVHDANYLNTGYYNCFFNETAASSKVGIDMAELYVYVYDENHLFALSNEYEVLTATQYDQVILPCKTTHPNISVTLTRDSIEVDLSEDIFMEYNSKKGFVIKNALISVHAGVYECSAFDFKTNMSSSIYVHLDLLTLAVDAPTKPHINDTSASPAHFGGNFTLDCSVLMPLGVVFNIEWRVPDSNALKTGHAVPGNHTLSSEYKQGIEYRFAKLPLYVTNVTKEDEGYYHCIVVNHGGKQNNESKLVEVIDQDTNYLNMAVKGGVSEIQVPAGTKEIQWVVEIEAYPAPELRWYKPDGQEITLDSKSKYEMIFYPKEAILKVRDVDIADSGTYVLKATTDKKEENLNLTLEVLDKPAVTILNVLDYYILAKNYTLECKTYGNPKPEIIWYFKNCTDYEECSGVYVPWDDNPIIGSCGTHCYNSSIQTNAMDSVVVKCFAKNEWGEDYDSFKFLISEVSGGFGIEGPEEGVEGDDVRLLCSASVYNYSGEVNWFKNVGNTYYLLGDPEVLISDISSDFMYKKELRISDIKANDSGLYVCRVPILGPVETTAETEHSLFVRTMMPTQASPANNMKNKTATPKPTDGMQFICSVLGVPEPEITWYKDNVHLELLKNDTRREFINGNQILDIKFVGVEDNGKYECRASNRGGVFNGYINLEVAETVVQQGFLPIIIVGSISGLVLAIVCFIFIMKIRKEKSRRRELSNLLREFKEGNVESINPDLPIDDQAALLPYDGKWEFPREKISLGKQLGSGAFGRVVQAQAEGIIQGVKSATVAVKMVKSGADPSHVSSLLSELKILAHLGKHLNVVNLLGACTDDVNEMPDKVWVIVEFCRFGNLQNYLLRHREEFVNQIDPKTGYIDPKIGADKLRSESVRKRERDAIGRLNYTTLEFPDDFRISRLPSGTSDITESGPSQMNTANTYLTQMSQISQVSMSPTGCPDEPIFDSSGSNSSRNSSQINPAWRSNYRGDYRRSEVRAISSSDLICWAFQIARGMDYLSSRKVLHRDLAARNILLAEGNIVKICDFGLAKDVYKKENYKKKGEGPLPVKWMAIECIQDQVFSTQSDVWSFGIVLWELFALGKTPYPAMEADDRFFQRIIDGYRMDKPPLATADIYKIMLDCWKADPNTRPTFAQLASNLDTMLEDTVREHYLKLNKPYMAENEKLQESNPDYLSMMAAPEYSTMIQRNTPERDTHTYLNVPEVGGDGYLIMSPRDPRIIPLEDGSGYLFMNKSPGDIFSPRPKGEDFVFNFDRRKLNSTGEPISPSELRPMLSSTGEEWPQGVSAAHSRDSGLVSPTDNNSFSAIANPSYRFLPTDVTVPPEYINMPTIVESLEDSVCKERQDSGKGSDISNESDNVFMHVNGSTPNYINVPVSNILQV